MPRAIMTVLAGAIAAAMFFASPAAALRDDVQAAVNAIEKLRADDAKMQEYCAIQSEIQSAGDDEAKLDAAYEKLDAFYDGLGEAYSAIFDIDEELPPDSEDARALDDAFAALDGECET